MTAIRGALLIAATLAVWPATAVAQNYRVRLDARGQSVSFRGSAVDSILETLAVPGANGGLQTSDGYAVRCTASPYCYYFRAGPILRGLPVTTSASVSLWGLGVEGLAFHATGRLVADMGKDDVWPGMESAVQLLEGYLEYRRSQILARAGRLLVSSRLESMGFDGGSLNARVGHTAFDITAYGGWGLGQASTETVLSPALNPLDEWRPRNRQLVSGAEASWNNRYFDARGEYRREMDPNDHAFVSERTALSVGATVSRFRATGGFDYNIAEGVLGNADATLTYVHTKATVSAGIRQYRPFFSLWTLWGAFSPVPYRAVNASVQFRPLNWLTLQSRGERYRYDDAEVSTALVPQLEDQGWRVNNSATATVNAQWSVSGSYSVEHGPGASGRFADASVTWTPSEQYALNVYGGNLSRPLELRYYDATSKWIGGRAEWQVTSQQRVWADVARVADDRNRPDAGAWNMSQTRVRAGLSLTFGSRADRLALPPARPPALSATSRSTSARAPASGDTAAHETAR